MFVLFCGLSIERVSARAAPENINDRVTQRSIGTCVIMRRDSREEHTQRQQAQGMSHPVESTSARRCDRSTARIHVSTKFCTATFSVPGTAMGYGGGKLVLRLSTSRAGGWCARQGERGWKEIFFFRPAWKLKITQHQHLSFVLYMCSLSVSRGIRKRLP